MIILNSKINLYTNGEMFALFNVLCKINPDFITDNCEQANLLFIKYKELKGSNKANKANNEYIIIASQIKDNNKKEYILIHNIDQPKGDFEIEKVQTSDHNTLHKWEIDDFANILKFDSESKYFISKEFFKENDPEQLAYPLIISNPQIFREFEIKIGLTNNLYSNDAAYFKNYQPAYGYDLIAGIKPNEENK